MLASWTPPRGRKRVPARAAPLERRFRGVADNTTPGARRRGTPVTQGTSDLLERRVVVINDRGNHGRIALAVGPLQEFHHRVFLLTPAARIKKGGGSKRTTAWGKTED